MTESGVNTNSRTLGESDLSEGTNYVHVVPISGSGMRATAVGHTPLKVDTTDPTTTIDGVPSDWVNHPVEVTVTAEDALSGMTDTAEYPEDAPPRTVLAVDGIEHEDLDSEVVAAVAGEGIHNLRFWARDLAGNENDGDGSNPLPGAELIKIDLTGPDVAFRNEQDPADPDRLVAPVADELSGVIDGAIEYRRHGTQSWITLETALDAGALVARVDSNDLEAGVGYEFRAQATDAAGNSAVTNLRADGSEMSVTGPFRRPAAISEFTINGKNRARIGYGRRALVSGRLLDASRKPIANAPVELVQSYDPGSTHRTDSIAASTDAAGRFRAKLPKGPSRTVKAQFAGDLQRLGASSESRRLRVRGKISLKAPRRVRAGGRATFSGRVKAAGATFSRGGKAVEVQVRIGSRWKTVGRSLRTDRRGHYRLKYRFVANYTRPIRYRFRAVALRERGWPYLPSVSTGRRVLVRP